LFGELHESVKQYYDPKVFCHAFKDWDNRSINVLEQMDVDEFFNLFLDKLESAIKGTKKEKTIKKHFGGTFANQLLCKDCPHSRQLDEPFLAVNLQVKNKKSLEKCLENFVEGEMLQGDNAYNCEKCDKKVTTLKRVCIKRLPRYLIFVLKRFDINYDTMQKFKINDYCEFPTFLNMEPFTVEGLAKKDQEKLRDEASKEGKDIDELTSQSNELPKYPSEYYEYKLSGIIIHMGTADAGHYYSFIKDREKTHLPENKRWFEFNDTIVERYDPEEIKDDAFGGEERVQRFDGIAFRSLEKTRNAYLLVYDRVSSYEPPEENEGEERSAVKEVIETTDSSLTIPENIHSEIMQENIKHWYSLYMFHDHYFEFALDLCMNWNSTENILDSYPCRNNDYKILGLSEEDFLASAFVKPKMQLPVCKPSNNKEVEVQVFKYLVTLVLTTLFRLNIKNNAPEFMNLMKAHMNKNKESARWLLWQFSNQKVIMEFLFECNESDIRKLVVGLLYCAMLVVFEEEKTRLESPLDNDILINFTNAILKQLSLCYKYPINVEQYFQVISRLTFLGPEIRTHFYKTKLLNLLISFLANNKDIDCTAIVFKENANPEIGLPSEIDERFQSPLEKFLSANRERKDQGTHTITSFLVEAISFLLRSVTYEDALPPSPFALPDCKMVLDLDMKKVLSEENIVEIIGASPYYIAIPAVSNAFKHLSWECTSFKNLLLNSIIRAIRTTDTRKVIVSVHLFEELISLEDSKQTIFVPIALSEFNKMLKNGAWTNQVQTHLLKHMVGFAKFVPLANEWYCKNLEQWKWILDSLKISNVLIEH
jgi:ubiquitin carboxyl-terminal hydrolase 9/24